MAMILSAVVDACTSKLADLVVDKVGEKVSMMRGVKDELNKLLRKMERIGDVLEDAERKKLQDASIRRWVCELTDIMYDADDIIDLCWAKAAQLLEDHQAPSPTPPIHRQSFSSQMVWPMKNKLRVLPGGERTQSGVPRQRGDVVEADGCDRGVDGILWVTQFECSSWNACFEIHRQSFSSQMVWPMKNKLCVLPDLHSVYYYLLV